MSCGAEISNKFCTVECGMVDNIKHGLKLFGGSSGVCLSNPDLFWRVYSMADIQVCFCFLFARLSVHKPLRIVFW